MITHSDLKDIQAFLKNHKDEISPREFRFAMDAARQMEYWFLDGKPSDGYDTGIYTRIMESVCFQFVQPTDDGDWYDHPKDFPAYYEKQLM